MSTDSAHPPRCFVISATQRVIAWQTWPRSETCMTGQMRFTALIVELPDDCPVTGVDFSGLAISAVMWACLLTSPTVAASEPKRV